MINKKQENNQTKRTHRGRVWLWLFIVILIIAGATTWVLHDGGVVNWNKAVEENVSTEIIEQSAEIPAVEEQNAVVTEQNKELVEIKPTCEVIEDLLLKEISPDDSNSVYNQEYSSKIYTILTKYGCPENAMFFTDMAVRKQAIADGLKAANKINAEVFDPVAANDYLYSDEKICQTIENRVLKNINQNAYNYYEFLDNAKTYATLYEYGCKANNVLFARAAIRELGVAVALMPTDKMTREEIITVVEICKRLGVADAAHLMLQRLKARGYDMEFLLEMEDIIHAIR